MFSAGVLFGAALVLCIVTKVFLVSVDPMPLACIESAEKRSGLNHEKNNVFSALL